MSRRVLALLLGVTVPTVLLGMGWLGASLRERQAREREQRATLARVADAVRGAVDESLEELRAREDGRPFYVYNHYYSPPDVLAINDPVAVSPLAGDPRDDRLIGHFQVEPGGAVRTPYAASPGAEPPGRAQRVLAIARSSALTDLRAATGDAPVRTNLVAWADAGGGSDAGVAAAPPAVASARPRRRAAPTRPPAPPAQPPPVADNAGPPQGPLTVTLNPWVNDAAEDIQLAQAGSVEANFRVQQRGRSAPIFNRNTVEWSDVARATPAPAPAPAPASTPAPAPAPAPRRRAAPPAPAPPAPAFPIACAQQDEAEVDYTPMAWLAVDDLLLLHRIVSHEGAAVVQVAVVDRAHLVTRWLPEVVARHAGADRPPAVVSASQPARCAVRRPASQVLDDVELCFAPEALAAATTAMDDDLELQAAMLLGLLAMVFLGVFVVHRAARREEELSRQKSAFVSAVSHELRTPLTTIRMHAEMLADGLVSEARRDRVHGELVGESVRLARLVDNVLELSRIEAGRRALSPRVADLAAHVRGVCEGQRAFLEDRGIELRVEVPAKLEAAFDAQAVDQMLVNLLENAAKYAADADPPVVDVELTRGPGRVVLAVRDRGPGIPEAERERVFERFHRIEDETTAHKPGTGIGLSLVRELARAHGGDARVLGREGGGADVRVSIPLV